jgi:hypothetical protein
VYDGAVLNALHRPERAALVACAVLVACTRKNEAPAGRAVVTTAPPAPAPSLPAASAPAPRASVAPKAAPTPGLDASVRTTPHPMAGQSCRAPLADYCHGRCPAFDQARAQALRGAGSYVPELCSGLGSGDVAVGACGAHRFVEDGDCLSGATQWFDASGKLVGVYAWGDVKRSCGFSTIYGDVPACAPR